MKEFTPEKATTIFAEMKITLENIYHGGVKKIEINALQVCRDCEGQGGYTTSLCHECKGSGILYNFMTMTCCHCDGTGRVAHPEQRCKTCDGHRVVLKKRTLEVSLPQGYDQQYITLTNQGNKRPNHGQGDVIIILTIMPH